MGNQGKSLVLILLCSLVLVSCSQAATTGDGGSGEKIQIRFMHWYAYVTDEVIAAFEEEHPEIDVVNEYVAFGDAYFSKLQSMAATNDLPDVFGPGGPGEGFYEMIKEGKVLDLYPFLETPTYEGDKKWGESQSDVLMANYNSGMDVDPLMPDELKPKNGHQWALPFGAISLAVIYNKNIFEEVGIKPPETFTEFLDNNDKLRAAGYVPLAHAGNAWGQWWYTTFLDQTAREITAQDYIDGKVQPDDPRIKEAFEIWEDMIKRKHFDEGAVSAGIEDAQALFVQQRAAQFYVVPENFVKYLVDNVPEGVKLGAFVLPGAKGLPSRSIGGAANRVAVSAQTEHQEAAILFAKFMTSQTIFNLLSKDNVVPSVKGYVPPEGDEIMGAYAKAYENGFAESHDVPLSPENSAKWGAILSGVLIGEIDSEEAVRQIAELWNKDDNNPNKK